MNNLFTQKIDNEADCSTKQYNLGNSNDSMDEGGGRVICIID